MDGQNQGREVEDGEGGFFYCDFALACDQLSREGALSGLPSTEDRVGITDRRGTCRTAVIN